MQFYDVIIIGGGMVGASLALTIEKSGIKTALVDRQTFQPGLISKDDPWCSKVSALTEASVNLFKYLGVWQGMVSQRVTPYTHMTIWDREGTGQIEFESAKLAKNNLGYIVENTVVKNALFHRLAGSTVVCFGEQTSLKYKLSDQGGEVTLDNSKVISAPLLVAADGAESNLRRLSGIPVNQQDYKHHALIATVEVEHFHNNVARQVFLESGPLAFLPLKSIGGKNYCSIVWSLFPSEADRIAMLSDELFCRELQIRF